MATVENIIEPKIAQSGQLLRILGVRFGLAVGIGGTIGVGILRNPSGVAAQLPSRDSKQESVIIRKVFSGDGVQSRTTSRPR